MTDLTPRHASARLASCVAAAALALTGCKTSPLSSGDSAASQYATSCLTGAVAGAAIDMILQKTGVKKATTGKEQRSDLAKAALAGCALGLAATAIGRLMDERQQAKHEQAMQEEARRRALEQQQYASATQRAQTMPAATPQQRAARDAELAKARAAYQESLNRSTQVDLGNGGQSTIQVQPAPAARGVAAAPAGSDGACTEYSVLVRTAAGQARQFETWCPNAAGQMVRTDVREAPLG
jgi:hypothetical protein